MSKCEDLVGNSRGEAENDDGWRNLKLFLMDCDCWCGDSSQTFLTSDAWCPEWGERREYSSVNIGVSHWSQHHRDTHAPVRSKYLKSLLENENKWKIIFNKPRKVISRSTSHPPHIFFYLGLRFTFLVNGHLQHPSQPTPKYFQQLMTAIKINDLGFCVRSSVRLLLI